MNADELIKFADTLEQFPRHASDTFLYEVGSEKPEDRWAYYFRFRTFLVNARGHCAIQLRMNNNAELPYRELAEFCIESEAASINRLGGLFRELSTPALSR